MISYNDFYVVAVKGIQEQQAEIHRLLRELEMLESLVENKKIQAK